MKCTISGCPGEYEQRRIVHTVTHEGQLIVIDRVPAEVCAVCGDVLLEPETIRHLERMLSGLDQPIRTIPVYEYA
ncbi:MAG: YgiT-type zinc finger protein [Phycisphaerae bacterium]|nr:YgiT-type zinc finger protein [Phycisphaerae bacterium]